MYHKPLLSLNSLKEMISRHLHTYLQHKDTHFASVLLTIYVCLAYVTGLALLTVYDKSSMILSDYIIYRCFPSLVLLSHSLLMSAYLYHEALHNNIFRSTRTMYLNKIVATIFSWMNGACYWTNQSLGRQHINHHRYPIDYDCTSGCPVISWWKKENSIQRKILELCEYAYIPLHFYMYAWRAMYRSILYIEPHALRKMLRDHHDSGIHMEESWPRNSSQVQFQILTRTCTVLFIRAFLFCCLTYYSNYCLGLLIYLLAYNTMIVVLRFTDCFSHSYSMESLYTVKAAPDRVSEQNNTFSFKISGPQWWQTFVSVVFFLNFNLHNEHHLNMKTSWDQLSNVKFTSKMESSFPRPDQMSLDFVSLIKQFHIHRVSRLFVEDYGAPSWDENTEQWDVTNFLGAAEASFLVLEI